MLAHHTYTIRRMMLLLALALFAGAVAPISVAYQSVNEPKARGHSYQSEPVSRTFPQTNRTVRGKFLQYWDAHGGLPQQGYPVSEEMQERSDVDGKTYTVQYFQRAVFELHPEYAGTPYEVLLTLLGSIRYQQKYGGPAYPTGAPGQQPNASPGSVLYPQTGKRLGGRFLEYWQANGGLSQQGYPISDEFLERSELNGQTYRVQYFERAVFELHTENKPPYDVLLSQLGTLRFSERYAKGLAPPYEVIWRTAREIMSRYPQDPNDNHIKRPQELLDYVSTVRGMRVEDWQGWIGRQGPYKNPDGVTYSDIVYMEDPQGKDTRSISRRVSLLFIPEEQALKVKQWQASHPGVAWPKVRISGVISHVEFNGRVGLDDAVLEIIE